MFTRKPREKTRLDEVIDTALLNLDPNDDDYLKMVGAVETLYKLKDLDGPKRVTPDTMAIVLGNLAGILMIVSHERAHVVTSQALKFVLRR